MAESAPGLIDVPASSLTRRSPVEHRSEDLRASALDLVEEPFARHLVVRVDPHAVAATAVEDRLGLSLPVANSASNAAGPRSVIWLGPDEWLVVDAEDPVGLEPDLAAAVTAAGGAVVDVSGQRTTLRLRGPHARSVLAKGCAIDLHPWVVRHNLAQQTMLAHAGVVLVVVDPGTAEDGLAAELDCRLLVRSTFANYLVDWLLDAGLEYA